MRPWLVALALGTAAPPAAGAQVDSAPPRRAVVPGLVVGGIAGAGAGVLLGLIARAVCEYECGPVAGSAVVGGVLGAAAGTALGALVGAAIPAAPHGEPVGEVTLRLGATLATTGDDARDGAGPAVEVAFGPRFGRVAALLEVGRHVAWPDRRIWRYGVAARADLGGGTWRPYVTGGVGGYVDRYTVTSEIEGTDTEAGSDWFGGSLGAGLRHEVPGSRLAFGAEARAHVRLQDVGVGGAPPAVELVTLQASGQYRW